MASWAAVGQAKALAPVVEPWVKLPEPREACGRAAAILKSIRAAPFLGCLDSPKKTSAQQLTLPFTRAPNSSRELILGSLRTKRLLPPEWQESYTSAANWPHGFTEN